MVLQDTGSAYMLLDDGELPTVFPKTRPETQDAIQTIKHKLTDSNRVAGSHIRSGMELINKEDYASSVRESMHAVESIVVSRNSKNEQTFSKALKVLERDSVIPHPALARGILALYGYASNEEGIRHARVDNVASHLGIEEAVMMSNVCATIAWYLQEKSGGKL